MGATRTTTTGVGLLAVLVLSGCGTQVAGSGQLPVLRIGTQNGTTLGGAMDAARPAAANAAKGGASSTTDPYPLHGTLPTGPSSAPVYRYADAQVPQERVAALAGALGLTGTPTRHAHGWEVTAAAGATPTRDGAGATLLVRDGSGQWSYGRGGDQCPVYTVDIDNPDGATTGVGCAASTTVSAGSGGGPASGGGAVVSIPDCATTATTCTDVVTTSPCPGATSACQETTATGGGTVTCANEPVPLPSPTSSTVPAYAGPDCVIATVGPVPQCSVSGAGSGGTCATPVPPSTTTAPVPSEPAPKPTVAPVSDAKARSLAAPLLAALGLDGTAPQVVDGGVSTDVVVDPIVGGLPTQGIATRVSVDAAGVVAATGWLGEASEGPTYPLVTAAAALDRLRTMPVPEIAIACIQGASCDGGIQTHVVTGATLGLTLRWDGAGTTGSEVLVPSWFFTIEGSTDPLAWVAVQDSYLGDPTPDPGVTAPGSGSSPGNPGDPGASAAPPSPVGTDAPPPATDQPGTVGTDSGTGQLLGVAITSVTLGKDGSTLIVRGYGGVCEDYTASATESATSVTLALTGTPNQEAGKSCPAMAKEVTATVHLAAPWDKRTLVDAATGQTLTIS